jgi:hypothetical protein
MKECTSEREREEREEGDKEQRNKKESEGEGSRRRLLFRGISANLSFKFLSLHIFLHPRKKLVIC